MVVAEALAGMALIKAGVDGIKGAINTANDVGAIAKYVDNLFEGRDQVNRDKNKARQDPFGIKSIATETINAKLAEEQLDEMRQLIDFRFGHGTWASIVAERARRIQEAKEAEKQKRIAARRRREETIEFMGIMGSVIVGAVTLLAILWFIVFRRW
tara:strand:- start:6 stop:473 length:468 start_codon:yes stop_codon:yes gene_type:complete